MPEATQNDKQMSAKKIEEIIEHHIKKHKLTSVSLLAKDIFNYIEQSKQEEVKCDNPDCTMNNPILSYHCSDCIAKMKPQPQEKVMTAKEYLLYNLKEFPNHEEYNPKLIDAIADFMNGYNNYTIKNLNK